jgi:hypothetical protein
MATKIKTRGFVFNFTPLSLAHGIAVINGVADRQNYNDVEKEYVPDYTLTPITLSPWVNIVDRDGVLTSGSVKASLADIAWTVTIGGVTTTITTATSGYTIKSDGDTKGDLIIQTNVAPDTTATYRFKATYLDTRTRQTFAIEDSYLLICSSATGSTPTLTLNFNDTFTFNPIRCSETYTVTPSLFLDGKAVASANFALAWQIKDATTTAWRALAATDTGLTVSEDGKTLTLTTKQFYGPATIRVRAAYDRKGSPSTDDLTDASPEKVLTITRRIPDYEADIQAPTAIPADTEGVYASVDLYDNQGLITEAAKGILLPMWYIATDQSDGSPELTEQFASGYEAQVPTAYMDAQYGMMVGVEMLDVQPVQVLTDSDGDYITDSDGEIILI